MRKELSSLISFILLLGLFGNASAAVTIDDFESYADTADLRTTWSRIAQWGSGPFNRYLDTTAGVGNGPQSMRLDAVTSGTGGNGGWTARFGSWDWSGEAGIGIWIDADVSAGSNWSDVNYRVFFREAGGDRWKTPALSIYDAIYGVPQGGGYVFLPWSLFTDINNAGDGVMQLGSIDRFQVSGYAWETALTVAGDSATIWFDNIAANQSQPPVANAKPDQTVNEGDTVNLDGTGSSDPDGAITTYAWTQNSGPTVTLLRVNTATPSFTAPEVTTDMVLTFTLTVTDNNGLTSTDSVNIMVQDVLSNVRSLAFGARELYYGDTDSLEYKQSAVQELSNYFDALNFGIHNWALSTIAEAQEWIDVCENYNVGFIFHSLRYSKTYTSGDISSSGYNAVKLNSDGTFTTLTGNNDYDVLSPAAAQYRADLFKEKLLLLSTAKDVYFMFNEDTLAGFQKDSQPYYQSPTYSDDDLQSFRDHIRNQTARFPVDIPDASIPVGSQYKIAYAAPGDTLWDSWWDWRFRAFADYLGKMAQAVSEAFIDNPNYKGAIYVGMNRSVYEVNNMRMPAVSLEYIADSPYISVLLSDVYGTYTQRKLSERANSVFKQIAESHGKYFATMVELWRFVPKSLVTLRGVSEQIERNHKYQPDMTSAYPASVFHQGLSWSGYSTNPILSELWDARENLVQPSPSFRHAGFDWGSHLGSADFDANPSWITGVNQSGGYPDLSRSSYRVDSTEPNDIGSLEILVDRSVVHNDQTIGVVYEDNANSYMYIQLRDANGAIVVNNLTGNILTGDGGKLTTNFNIPLTNNPDVTSININRSFGNIEVYYTWLARYPYWYSYLATEDDLWIIDLQNSGGSWDPDSLSFKVARGAANDIGSLRMQVDRSVIVDDMTLTIDYWDTVSSYIYVRLRDANGNTVINNLTRNILTGTATRVTRSFTIPFSQYPNAAWIDINRLNGRMEVFKVTLSR